MITVAQILKDRLNGFANRFALYENANERISEIIILANFLNANGHILAEDYKDIADCASNLRKDLFGK